MVSHDSDVSPGRLRVLVTGASSGVGEATARLFASEGAAVTLIARRREELERIADESGQAAYPVVADVALARSASSAVHEAIGLMGGLDVAVNAAGVAGTSRLEDLDEHVWRRVLDTNLSGTFSVSREAGLHMRSSGGGVIVNVGSDLAYRGVSGLVHYCAAKSGVIGLTRALAIELAPDVRVNVVCPGPIDTPMLRSGPEWDRDPESALREKASTVPLNRLADPTEVANAIRFLAVEGTFATGASLAVDGGTTAG